MALNPKKMLVIHSTFDDDIVGTLCEDLSKITNIEFWYDHKPGNRLQNNDFRKWLTDAADECDSALVFFSSRASQSSEVAGEIETFLKQKKPIYFLKIDQLQEVEISPRYTVCYWIDITQIINRNRMLRYIASQLTDQLVGRPLYGKKITAFSWVIRSFNLSPIRGRDKDIENIQNLLRLGPTTILGIGGLGKSRLGMEIISQSTEIPHGAVWHVGSLTARPQDIIQLLKRHFEMDSDASNYIVFNRVAISQILVIIDDAEDIDPDVWNDYVDIIDQLYDCGAKVMIMSRVELSQLANCVHKLLPLADDAAEKMVDDLLQRYPPQIEVKPEIVKRIARAAFFHPYLIELSVINIRDFGYDKVLKDLAKLPRIDIGSQSIGSQPLHSAVKTMFEQNFKNMVAKHGVKSEIALKTLNVFRGGFKYETAQSVWEILVESDNGSNFTISITDLDELIKVLQRWAFITIRQSEDGTLLFYIYPLVKQAIGIFEAGALAHLEHYIELLDSNLNYGELIFEVPNLKAAFGWAIRNAEYRTKARKLRQVAYGLLIAAGRKDILDSWDAALNGYSDYPDDPDPSDFSGG